MTGLEAVVRRLELEELYTDYVHCLDADELERWPDFFTEDCFYRITSAENYEAGMPLGLIHATSRNMLKDRVTALREANIYERQRYRHIVGLPALREAGAAETPFLVVRIMRDGRMDLFATGRYLDKLIEENGMLKFSERIVVCDSARFDTLLAIPL